jgi:hypothetical protein
MMSADRAMYASKRGGRNRVAGPESATARRQAEEAGVPLEETDDRTEVVEPPV